jgi:hypothetical protein
MRKLILSIAFFLFTPCVALGQAILVETSTPSGTPPSNYEYIYTKAGAGVCAKLHSGVEICGATGSGTVNSASQYSLAYYPSTGTAVSGVNSPGTIGHFYWGNLNPTAAATAPQPLQIGTTAREVTTSPDTITPADCAFGTINYKTAATIAVALGTPASLSNTGCAFTVASTFDGTNTPPAVTITAGGSYKFSINGGALATTLTVASGQWAFVYPDQTETAQWDVFYSAITTVATPAGVDFLTITNAATCGTSPCGTPSTVNISAAGKDNQIGITVQGKDASLNGILGSTIVRGSDQTGTGGSNSQAGGILLRAGQNASTSGSSQAGGTELESGYSTAGGVQGSLTIGQYYTQGPGSVTQWNVECQDSAATTADDCPASPTSYLGVGDAHTGSAVEIHTPPGQSPVNASAAVTLGDTVCLGAASPKVTDSGGTGGCPTGLTFGKIVRVSGLWTGGDGDSASLSTSLPLVQMFGKTVQIGSGDASSAFNAARANALNIASYPNDGSAATVLHMTACQNASGNAQECIANAVSKVLGVVTAGAGTTGSPTIATTGTSATVTYDATPTVNHWAVTSATPGQVVDSGSTVFPTCGNEVVGLVNSTTTVLVELQPLPACPTNANQSMIASSTTGWQAGTPPVAATATAPATALTFLNDLLGSATRVGDMLYCSAYLIGCTAWSLVPGNNSGTGWLQETSAGVPSWTTPSSTAPSLDTVTGSAAQATGTETAAGHSYTFAGVETGALTYPFVFTDANSTANHTNGALVVQTTGTSTASVPLLINEATAAGNFVNFISGGTVTNGIESGGTSEFSVTASGNINFAGGLEQLQGPTSSQTCLGYFVGCNSSTGAISIGYEAGYDGATPGNYSILIGYKAGGVGSTLGAYNVGVGVESLYNASASGNQFATAVGGSSCLTVTSGTQDTCLGGNADVSSGSLTNATSVGYGAVAGASNTIVLGNSSVTKVYAGSTSGVSMSIAGGFESLGTTFTTNKGCSEGTLAGGASAGSFVSGTSGTCTTTITMGNSLTAPQAWSCSLHDITNRSDGGNSAAGSTTTAVVSIATTTGDTVYFDCMAF